MESIFKAGNLKEKKRHHNLDLLRTRGLRIKHDSWLDMQKREGNIPFIVGKI